jgi:hypothetical protein
MRRDQGIIFALDETDLLVGGELAHAGSNVHSIYAQPSKALYLALYAGEYTRKETVEDATACPR